MMIMIMIVIRTSRDLGHNTIVAFVCMFVSIFAAGALQLSYIVKLYWCPHLIFFSVVCLLCEMHELDLLRL